MQQISTREFERLPLRVHNFLAGVPLHVLASHWRLVAEGQRASVHTLTAPAFARKHPTLRRPTPRLGSRANHQGQFRGAFDCRDLSKSLAPPGTPEGPFRVVYRFENEQLLEVINRTAHAAALSALV